jgi:hypothetical protein
VPHHQTIPKVAVVVEAFSSISPERARELEVSKTAGGRLHNDPDTIATQLCLACRHFAQLEAGTQVTTDPLGLALDLITSNRQVIFSPVRYGKSVKGHGRRGFKASANRISVRLRRLQIEIVPLSRFWAEFQGMGKSWKSKNGS